MIAKYADAAIKHMHAWFVDEKTRMNPNLQYAQAIKGVSTGRGIGVIDTVHLIEVAKSASLLQQAGLLKGDDSEAIKKWFTDYLTWMTTSKNGTDEMNAANNHGTCWAEQVAAFASFTGDQDKLDMCRKRFKEVLLPKQIAADGSASPRNSREPNPTAIRSSTPTRWPRSAGSSRPRTTISGNSKPPTAPACTPPAITSIPSSRTNRPGRRSPT